MTKLTKTLLVIIVLFSINTNIAQNDSKPWIIGLGANAVDYYPVIEGSLNPMPTNNTSGFGDEYFNVGDHWNNAIISKLQIGRYLGHGFTFEFSPSINKITKVGDYTISSKSYLALDGNIKYAIKNLLKKDESTFFQPYLYFGGGYTWLEDIGAGTANMGLGSNFWFTEKMGAAIQTGYKTDVEDYFNSHFQHSLTFIYRFNYETEENKTSTIKEGENAVVEENKILTIKEKEDALAKEKAAIKAKEDALAKEKAAIKAKEDAIIAKEEAAIKAKEDAIAKEKEKAAIKANENTIIEGEKIINDKEKNNSPRFNNSTFNNCSFTFITSGEDYQYPNNLNTTNIEKSIHLSADGRYLTFEKTIYFETNFDNPFNLKTWPTAALNEVQSFALKYPSSTFTIEGHTDSRDSYEYNMSLSKRRANNVKKWLITHGIEESRLSTVAYGETKPIVPNNSAENMAKNRRVVIKMIGRILR